MRSMMAVVTCLVLAPFTLALSAEEQTIKKADVPSAVIAAFEKAYPKATVKSSSILTSFLHSSPFNKEDYLLISRSPGVRSCP
ncbi:MAG: hypothetical protein WCP22_00590 [Chlamydiota bacterium]